MKIGTVEYQLDESVQGHYDHRFVPLSIAGQQITGEPGKTLLESSARLLSIRDRVVGGMTDWSGGEGNNVFQQGQPSVYRISNGANGRVAGELTVRPQRTVATLTSEANKRQNYATMGDGALWMFQNTRGHFSTNWGATWTTLSEANSGVTAFNAAAFVTCAAGDDAFAYYAINQTTTKREILAHTAAVTTSSVVVSSVTINFPYAEMEVFNGRLYAWTGRKLFEIDVFETWPIDPTGDKFRKVFDTGVDPATSYVQGYDWTTGIANCGNSLVFFYARKMSGGTIYEYKNGVARPIWSGPKGFTIGAIQYKSGVLFIAGHWGVGLVSTGTDTVAEGSGQLYALPMSSLQEINLGKIRNFDGDTSGGLLMTRICDSYEGQIMLAGAGTGRIFIYDMQTDGLTMLDHLKNAPAGGDGMTFAQNPADRIGDMITAGPNRLVYLFQPNSVAATTVQVATYKDDTPLNRETDGQMATDSTTTNYLEEGEWDDDIPLSPKVLHGFHVQFFVEGATTSGLLANQRIIVQYSVDGAAYVTAGTVTSATTPTGPVGKCFLAVSGVRYHRLRVKYFVDNNNTDGVKPPVVYAVLRDSSIVDYIEEWDLVVRVKDEDDETSPSNRRYSGPQLRDNLELLFKNRLDVTFLDGYRYGKHSDPGTVTTHTVHMFAFEDVGVKLGESSCKISLRAIPAAA